MIDRHRTFRGLRAAILPCLAAPLLASADTPKNEDTGVSAEQCYRTESDTLQSCATVDIQGQDGQVGRDADPSTNKNSDGILGFKFRRLCNDGNYEGKGDCPVNPQPGDDPTDWGCTVDEVTHAMWEVKPTTGPRANTLKFTNYSAEYNPVGQYGSSTDATGYINLLRKKQLCGFNDWNIAHTDKVQTGVDFGNAIEGTAAVDPAYFPNMLADWYWNESPNPTSTTTAFAVDFDSGETDNFADRSTLRYVLGLRNGKDPGSNSGRYRLSPDGTEVYDTTSHSHLIWRRCVEGMTWDGTECTGMPKRFNHEQALQWAEKQAKAAQLPWRVPSVKEQGWIVQRQIPSPPVDHKAFPDTPQQPSWTSTPQVRFPKNAWVIDFNVGLVQPSPRRELHVLRLTRDPGAFAPDWAPMPDQ